MIRKLFPIWFVIMMFIEPLYLVICYQLGIEREGSLYKAFLASCFCVSLFFYLACSSKAEKKADGLLFFGLTVFGMIYYMTSVFYGYSNFYHTGHFLRWGVQCIPAVLVGLIAARYKESFRINYFIPLIVIVLTPFIAAASLRGGHELGQYKDETSGLNYQLISYFMAVLFGSTAYYLFFAEKKVKFLIVNLIMYACLAMQGLICAMSGGRGGFVLICVLISVLLYFAIKKNQISKKKIILIISLSIIVFLILANVFSLWDSGGFQRVINPLAQQTGRKDDWQEVLGYFWQSPVWGNGLGSDFYTWGFYSHNILVDFLAETGIIGFIILCTAFFKIEMHVFKQALVNNLYIFFCVFALYGLVMNMFSGYWISAYPNWLVLGLAWGGYVSKNRNINTKSNLKTK